MRTSLPVLILVIFIFYSCNYKKYKNKVVSNKGTWWDVYKMSGKIYVDPAYSYFCAVNGDCYFYTVKKLPGGSFKREIDHEHGKLPDTWLMRSDTIQLRGVDYLTHSRSEKKLVLIPLNDPADTLELIESLIK